MLVRLLGQMMTRELYWGTIAWDGYDEASEGIYTVKRNSLQDLLEDVNYYMDYFKARSPYVESASKEVGNGLDFRKTSIEADITEVVQEYIKNKTRESHGK